MLYSYNLFLAMRSAVGTLCHCMSAAAGESDAGRRAVGQIDQHRGMLVLARVRPRTRLPGRRTLGRTEGALCLREKGIRNVGARFAGDERSKTPKPRVEPPHVILCHQQKQRELRVEPVCHGLLPLGTRRRRGSWCTWRQHPVISPGIYFTPQ